MICNNCGGEFDNKSLLCPYCATENAIVAEHLQKERVAVYGRKIKDARKQAEDYSEVMGKKAAKGAFRGMIAGVVLVVAALLLFALVVAAVRGVRDARQESIIDKLESLYQSGDYTAMTECVDELEYDSRYRKYHNIARMENCYQHYNEYNADDAEYAIRDNDSTQLQSGIRKLIEILDFAKEIEEDGYPHDEEAGVAYYSNLAYTFLTDEYLLTDAEIESVIREELSIQEVAVLSLERLYINENH